VAIKLDVTRKVSGGNVDVQLRRQGIAIHIVWVGIEEAGWAR